MEIRSLEVDIDKGILKINGQDVDTPTIVTLPHVDIRFYWWITTSRETAPVD